MSLDSISLAAIKKELIDMFKDAKIVNIFQVKKYKIIFEVKPVRALPSYNSGSIAKSRKLFHIHISTDPSKMEIYFSEAENIKETISSPFLALLQSQLIGGKILDIKHPDFDRILHFIIQPYLKFGETKNVTLIVEFMGKHSNIILLNENNLIEGSIKSITSKINRYREVIPGKLYIPPPSQNKLNPLEISKENFFNIFYSCTDKELSLGQLLQNKLKGINPQSAKEIIFQANLLPDKKILEVSPEELESLWSSLNRIAEEIKHHHLNPTVFLDPLSKKIKTYSLIGSRQFPRYSKLSFNDANSCLKYFFTEWEKEREIISLKNKLENIINKNMAKLNAKMQVYQKKIEEVKNCERYKLMGELIKSNLGHIKRGDTEITTINYYSPQQEDITIPLNSSLTPLQNAQSYFKKYRKTKDSLKVISEQLNSNQVKLSQLEELQELYKQNSDSLSNLHQIYNNLVKLGLVKKVITPAKKQKKEINKLRPAKYISKDGWEIYVGKNNQQNDFLTLKLASGNDIWLHTKTIQGAHVIIKNKGGNQTPPLSTLLQAAQLAAYFSKAKNENKVMVDYTLKKYVKKPKNAKPGMVTYSHEKSLIIKINPQDIKDIISPVN
ncbi:MAG TPA: hypothetical protein DEG96_04255 [Candidatus Atribacteria bacterium]|nr:hypothetical protein [Candidatus Atribacteria bacterium]